MKEVARSMAAGQQGCMKAQLSPGEMETRVFMFAVTLWEQVFPWLDCF